MSRDEWRRVEHWQDKYGHAKDLGEVWTLRKGSHTARCILQGHPMAIEARVVIDAEVHRSEAFKDSQTMVDATWEWRQAFNAKGWS